jgi:Histidine phosphatase superfamily (branch 1)
MKTTSIRLVFTALMLICGFAHGQQNSRTIFLVRHAETTSAASAAPLSPIGEKRAECLAKTLAESGIKQIYVSDAKPAQQTAAPLAAKLKVSSHVLAAKDISNTVRNLLYGGTGNTLLVANGDTLPLLVQRLQAGKVSPVADNEFDRMFVLSLVDGSSAPAATLRYCEAVSSVASAAIKRVSQPVGKP